MALKVLTSPNRNSELQGVVTALLHKCSDGKRHSAVFSIISNKHRYRVVAPFGNINSVPVTGELWQVYGQHISDPTYGPQFEAYEGKRVAITENTNQQLVLDFIVYSPNFPGIGPTWAKKLDIAFKGCLVKSLKKIDAVDLEHHPILRMTNVMAESLILGWRNCSTEMQLIAFLDEKLIPKDMARELMHYWGDHAIETLLENPYRLMALMPAKSPKKMWGKVDKIAQEQFGISPKDTRRTISAIEACLYRAYDNEGHMCLPIKDVQNFLDKEGILHAVHDVVHKHGQSTLVIHDNRALVQNIGHFALEKIVSDRLNQLIHSPESKPLLFLDKLKIQFEKDYKQKNKLENFKLDQSQIEAVQLATQSRLSLITGGGGTGKTTIISAIVDQHESRNIHVWLLAPTGKAARRLAEETGHETETVFSFIQQLRKRVSSSQLHQTLIVIDEASMLDTPSAYALLKLLPNNCRLSLVGDIKQLPPVGPGLVFYQLSKYTALVAGLSKPYRQDGISDLHTFCNAIGQQDLTTATSVLHPFNKGVNFDVSYFEPNNLNEESLCNTAVNLWYEVKKRSANEVQLLAATRKTCNSLNTALQRLQKKKNKTLPRVIYNRTFFKGDPIIYEQNNKALMISNGSTGIIKEIYREYVIIAGRECVVTIDFHDEGTRHLTLSECLFLELAYCITTHKSQGSQYMHSVVVLDNPYLIDNSWLYTASSRSRKSVLFIGSLELILNTITSPSKANRRHIGYSLQIEEYQI